MARSKKLPGTFEDGAKAMREAIARTFSSATARSIREITVQDAADVVTGVALLPASLCVQRCENCSGEGTIAGITCRICNAIGWRVATRL